MVAQGGLVEVADGFRPPVDPPAVGGRPPARRGRRSGWRPPHGCAAAGPRPGSCDGRTRRPPPRRFRPGAARRGPAGPGPPRPRATDMASATARSWAPAMRSAVAGSASAQATLTDLGAENVRSNPGTRPRRPADGTSGCRREGRRRPGPPGNRRPRRRRASPSRGLAAPSQ